jgi:hypothetical protein
MAAGSGSIFQRAAAAIAPPPPSNVTPMRQMLEAANFTEIATQAVPLETELDRASRMGLDDLQHELAAAEAAFDDLSRKRDLAEQKWNGLREIFIGRVNNISGIQAGVKQ